MKIVSKESRKRDAIYVRERKIVTVTAAPAQVSKRKVTTTTPRLEQKKKRGKNTTAAQRREAKKRQRKEQKKVELKRIDQNNAHKERVRQTKLKTGNSAVTIADLAKMHVPKDPVFVPFKAIATYIAGQEKIWFKFGNKTYPVDMSAPQHDRMYRYAVIKDHDFGMRALKQHFTPEEFMRVEVLLGFKSAFSDKYIKTTFGNFAFLRNVIFNERPVTVSPPKVKLGNEFAKRKLLYTRPDGKKKMYLVRKDRRISARYPEVSSVIFDRGDHRIKLITSEAFNLLYIHGAFDDIMNTSYGKSYNFCMPLWRYVSIKIGTSTRLHDAEDIRYFIDNLTIKKEKKYPSSKLHPKQLVSVSTGENIIRVSRAEAEFLIKENPELKYASKAVWKSFKEEEFKKKDKFGHTLKSKTPQEVLKSLNKANKFIRSVVPPPEKKKALKQAKNGFKLFHKNGKKHILQYLKDMEIPSKVIDIRTLGEIPEKMKKTFVKFKVKKPNKFHVLAEIKHFIDYAKLKQSEGYTLHIAGGPKDVADMPFKITHGGMIFIPPKKVNSKVIARDDERFPYLSEMIGDNAKASYLDKNNIEWKYDKTKDLFFGNKFKYKT